MAQPDLLCFNIQNAFEGSKFQEALEKLPNEEQSSVLRFKFARDQHLTLGGLLLRRYYFSKHFNVPWSQLEFDRHPGGKPYLKHYDNIDFNISHEGYWVIFGCIKDMSIGVDVVVVDSSNSSLDEFIHVFESQLTIDEMSLIANSNYDKFSTFYEIWGCKESYIKATGVGLALELDQLNFRNENDMIKLYLKGKRLDSWSFYMTYIDPCTIAVVCCGRNDSSIVNFHNTNTKLIGEPIPSNQANLFHQCQLHTLLP